MVVKVGDVLENGKKFFSVWLNPQAPPAGISASWVEMVLKVQHLSAYCFCATGEAKSKAQVPLGSRWLPRPLSSSASPTCGGTIADDALGLVDRSLCLAAHQNHPREAGDLILCPRFFPHQRSAWLLQKLLPLSRKEKIRKKKSNFCPSERSCVRQWLLDGKTVAKPSQCPGIPIPP